MIIEVRFSWVVSKNNGYKHVQFYGHRLLATHFVCQESGKVLLRAFFLSIETRNVLPRISRDIVARGTIVWIRKNIHELGVAFLFPGKTELQGGMAEPPLSPFCYAGMRNDLLSLRSTPDAQCRLRHESNRTILRRALPPSLPIGHWGERRREKLPTIKQRGGEGDLAGGPEQKRERDRETGEIGNELTRTTRKWDPKHCGTDIRGHRPNDSLGGKILSTREGDYENCFREGEQKLLPGNGKGMGRKFSPSICFCENKEESKIFICFLHFHSKIL